VVFGAVQAPPTHPATLDPRTHQWQNAQVKGAIVGTFLAQIVLDGLVLFVFSIPLILVARRHGRQRQLRSFLIAGAVVVVTSTLIEVSSERLVERCLEAGNKSCNDFGSAGFRLLLMGGYVVVALIEAYLIAQD
jgi:hypothetical protein